MIYKPMGLFLKTVVPSWVAGITLPPFGIYLRDFRGASLPLKMHEAKHWMQYKKYGLIGFYALYLWYLFCFGYNKHPMEIEAREIERQYRSL